MLTATVRGPTEEFQKKLRSNPYSASDLEDPAEKVLLRHKTADAPHIAGKRPKFGKNSRFGRYVRGHRPFYCGAVLSLQQTPNQTQSKSLI